jgi:hypothetical protein
MVGDIAIEKSGGGIIVRMMVAVCVIPPEEVPVTVNVSGPKGAQLAVAKVSVLLLVVVAGLNDADIPPPTGKPLSVRLTAPLKPLRSFTAMVLVPVCPPAMVMLLVKADSVKSGVSTVSATVVVWTRLPDVPVTVMVAGPAVAVLDAVSVNMLVPVVLDGLNDAVTPAGRPLATRLTAPLKPFRSVTATTLLPLAPCATLTGEADRE